MTDLGTPFLLPDHMTSNKFTAVPGPWIFCRITTLVLCCRWPSKACKVFCSRSQSSQINITSSTPWAYFSDVRKNTCDRSSTPSHGMWHAVNTSDRSSWKANPKRGTDFLTVSFLLGGHQPLVEEPFRKYTPKSENISVTLTKWQLNRVQLQSLWCVKEYRNQN